MALITCKDCGRQISKSAKACPHCGKPIKKSLKGSAILILAITVFAAVVWLLNSDSNPSEKTAHVSTGKMTGDNLTTESFQTRVETPACKTADMISKMVGFAAARDRQAYATYFRERVATGECKILPQGSKVFLEEASLLGDPCVRIKGETACAYVPRSLLDPIIEPAAK